MSMNAMNKHTPEANEFTGKRVLVTGGTKGVGKAIADRFQHGGATVIITARSAPTEKTDNHFIQADVSTAEGTTKVINEILNRFRGIDIIIHNVGGTSAPSGGFITATDEIWQQSLNENLFQALLPDFVSRSDKSAARCGCPADVVNDNVNSPKTIQDFVDHLRCAFSGRDIRLDKVVVRLFRRSGARGYDDGCSAVLETIGNRLANALCAARHQDPLASEFIRFW